MCHGCFILVFSKIFCHSILVRFTDLCSSSFAKVVLRGLQSFLRRAFHRIEPQGQGGKGFSFELEGAPNVQDLCVCAHARISAGYSAFRSIRLSGPRLGSLQEFQSCCYVKGSSCLALPQLALHRCPRLLRLLVPVPLLSFDKKAPCVGNGFKEENSLNVSCSCCRNTNENQDLPIAFCKLCQQNLQQLEQEL